MHKAIREQIRTRANLRCEYCRVPEQFDHLPFQPDHIVALKHGGATDLDNLAWSCFDCNIFKGPNIAGIDPVTGDIVPLFHPRRSAWTRHFEWSGAELQGLTPAGRATISVLRINLERRVAFRQSLIDERVFPVE